METETGKSENNVINNKMSLESFNVRTMRTPEKELELDNALKEIQFDIIGLSELRKMGENIIEKANQNLLYYIGQMKGQKRVGFLVHKSLKYQIEEFIYWSK